MDAEMVSFEMVQEHYGIWRWRIERDLSNRLVKLWSGTGASGLPEETMVRRDLRALRCVRVDLGDHHGPGGTDLLDHTVEGDRRDAAHTPQPGRSGGTLRA
jgi:hypothetical protein